MSIVERLVQGSAHLGVTLTESDAGRLLRLLDELERWNRTYNLTAIRNRDDMLTHHLLDSVSIHPDLEGTTVADVGTGAGFPGLPLAVLNPQRRFTLIDSNGKKIRFVQHAARELGLDNVEGLHGRVEVMKDRVFDTVVARAFAALPELVANVAPLCGPQTRVLAMKGKWPQSEIDGLPAPWRQQGSREVTVPGLNESRCVVVLSRG
ncbi:MAG: rRNA (guanine527-N7)-methyltransferase [Gammaproteobacteria bacterium]|nr:rRNA (guanine527-N7)-methyltransferase [Gammaproteobacteria bacterium]